MIYWYAKKLSNIIKSRLIAEKITREIKHQRVYAQLCIITIIISTLQYVICYNILFQQLHYRYKYLYKIYHFIWTALQIIAKVVSPVTRHTQRSTPTLASSDRVDRLIPKFSYKIAHIRLPEAKSFIYIGLVKTYILNFI